MDLANLPPLQDKDVVYRAYSRALAQGRVRDKDFFLRDNEHALSVATTPEKAMGTLSCRGYVPVLVGNIRDIGRHGSGCIDVIVKAGCFNPEDDPDLYHIVGIPCGEDIRTFISVALADVAESPVAEAWRYRK